MEKEILIKIIKNQDVKFIAKYYYGYDLTPGQVEIVRAIAFRLYKRISISAMTRYGKSQCVALAIAMILDFDLPLKIAFIGPKDEQAHILRQYLAELVYKNPSLLAKAQLFVSGEERIQKEASRKRMTFSTGAEYRVFSAEGDANRLMGFGANIVIKDEACLIGRNAHAKIMRMLGDNPEDAMLIELYNPWDRDNVAFEHTFDPKFKVFRIGWQQAVEEGRTTAEFIQEQKKEITPLEFTVLYESEFPGESQDSLYNLSKLQHAQTLQFNFEEKIQKIEEMLKNQTQLSESQVKKLKDELNKYTRIVSCDPADKGLDETVIMWGVEYENKYELVGWYSEAKSESMQIVGKIFERVKEFVGRRVKGEIHLDQIGVGVGPLSRLKELIREKNYHNVSVKGCHFGKAAIKKDNFINKKSENYFRNKDLFQEDLISLPNSDELRKLIHQLTSMKWELTSSGKKKVLDPGEKPEAGLKKEKDSPDWGDCLVYFTWKDNCSLAFGFG